MPQRIERPCRAYLCPNTTSNPNGYCMEHQGTARQHEADRRESAYRRGYDRRWERFREAYLREYPLCEDCLKQTLPGESPQPATEVHHIRKLAEHPELKYVKSNLMGLCHRHHSIRTARGE